MTVHACRTFDPTCYRCDLGRDEELSGLAEDYFDVMVDLSAHPDALVRGYALTGAPGLAAALAERIAARGVSETSLPHPDPALPSWLAAAQNA